MSRLTTITLALAIAAVGSLSTGCGNGQDRSAKTASTSAVITDEVTRAKQQLDQVVAGLRNVRDASDTADLKKLYNELQGPAGELRGSLASVQGTAERAATAARKQNDDWRREADAFTDPDLRNASSKRQNDLRNAADALTASNAALKTTGDAFTGQLDQAVKALDLDLSQQGLQAIKPSVGRLIDDEAKLRAALTDVASKGKAVNGVINP